MTDPTYTDLAVAIGRLEEGQKNILSGLGDIKEIARDAIERVGKVEQAHAVTQREVADLRSEVADSKRAAEARRPPWTAIAAIVIAGASFVKQYLGL